MCFLGCLKKERSAWRRRSVDAGGVLAASVGSSGKEREGDGASRGLNARRVVGVGGLARVGESLLLLFSFHPVLRRHLRSLSSPRLPRAPPRRDSSSPFRRRRVFTSCPTCGDPSPSSSSTRWKSQPASPCGNTPGSPRFRAEAVQGLLTHGRGYVGESKGKSTKLPFLSKKT